MKFIDRQREMRALNTFYRSEGAGLFILFGRRRVGKTSLVSHFLESNSIPNAFYWMATTHSAFYQLRDFSQALLRYDPRFAGPPTADFTFPSWEAALQHAAEMVEQTGTPHLLILDEFTYLIRNERPITSIFQKMWDHRLSKVNGLKLILTGSLLGMMGREIFAYNAPLHGRATAQLRLRPLPYAALLELFTERSVAERIAIYAVTGGIPAYLERFTHTPDFVTALREDCLGPGSIMLTDPALILQEQLQEPQTYESILSVIAAGFHTWHEIATMAGVGESSLGHYLKVLQELELIERRDPILTKGDSRRGRYYVSDHFLRFYYRFLVPHLSIIERGYAQAAIDKIYAQLRSFIGTHLFEELCREWVWPASVSDQLSFQPETVGSYWRQSRGQGVQLDIVAASARQKQLLVGEAKWGAGLVDLPVLTSLMQRSQRMPQVAEGWHTDYALFAREGFTPTLQAEAVRLGVLLVTATELERTLSLEIA